MRQRFTRSFRIMAPSTNRGILFVFSLFLGMLVTVLAAALLNIPALPLILGMMQGDWLRGFACAVPTLLVALSLWKGLCLLTDGTFENVEVGPEGLLVQGLFGRRHRRWDEVDRFSVGIIPVAVGIVTVVARPASGSGGRPMRFFMSGYFRTGWFDDIGNHQDEIADWLQDLKAVYMNGARGGKLPSPPEYFVGRVTELPSGSIAAKLKFRHATD